MSSRLFDLSGLPNVTSEKEKCATFLKTFKAAPIGRKRKELKYMDMIHAISEGTSKNIDISLDDINLFNDDEFFANIKRNTKRYIELFSQAIDDIIGDPVPDVASDNPQDLMRNHRIEQYQKSQTTEVSNGQSIMDAYPKEVLRRYELTISPESITKGVPIREIDAKDIGSYVTIKAMVTRVSILKPLVKVAAYICRTCGCEIYKEVTSTSFMPVFQCNSEICRTNKKTGDIIMNMKGFKWHKYQELTIQETSDQVPVGHIPRIMTVHCEGINTQKCNPGDIITISGIFLPIAFTGFKGLRAGLITDTYLSALNIVQMNAKYTDISIPENIEKKIEEVQNNDNIYELLSRSIAPQIFGHVDIKKALLLELIGGVTRDMKDGISIRGDINICLMGDPGVAKSQLLKYISVVAPRSVYTTGKGSSSVGLTAAVLKDKETGEITVEAGALVLADKGICCIDEFDKMDEFDRTSIHEVMEQQTVSIAKAGIQTRLNARTSILAAANPLFGRYNTKRTPGENINLPAALLSRFDLLWLIIDKADATSDDQLAQHITHVHRYGTPPPTKYELFDVSFLKAYVAKCREHDPFIPTSLESFISEAYIKKRQDESQISHKNGDDTMMTARQLLSILRLSQAHARVYMRDEVTEEDVLEALRLLDMSKASILNNERNETINDDVYSKIYDIIRNYAITKNQMSMKYTEIEPIVTHQGFSRDQLEGCLQRYQSLNVFSISENRNTITFTSS